AETRREAPEMKTSKECHVYEDPPRVKLNSRSYGQMYSSASAGRGAAEALRSGAPARQTDAPLLIARYSTLSVVRPLAVPFVYPSVRGVPRSPRGGVSEA